MFLSEIVLQYKKDCPVKHVRKITRGLKQEAP
jgi:hypothetical protein